MKEEIVRIQNQNIYKGFKHWRLASFSTADCTWDFFSCTNKFGTWPDNKICCESRFDRCCEKVNGPKKKVPPKPEKSEIETSLSSSSTAKPTVENSAEKSGGEGLQLSEYLNLIIPWLSLVIKGWWHWFGSTAYGSLFWELRRPHWGQKFKHTA